MRSEQTKEQLIALFSRSVGQTLDELAKLEEETSKVKSELSQASSRLIAVTAEANRIKAEAQDQLRQAENEMRKIDVARSELGAESDSFYQLKDKLSKEISENRDTIARQEEKITYLKNEVKSMELLRVAKESLETELNELNAKVTSASKDLSAQEAEHLVALNATLKELEAAKKELAGTRANNEKELNLILPRIEELNEREKQVKIKEEGLKTIEDRYKRLYAEKGANFKL